MKQIPNLFTLLNLVFGFIAIICILQTGESLLDKDGGSWVATLPEKIWWGAIFIGIAALVDFLDGFVARLFKAESALGKQLDSLADVVSFGVAPGLILYQMLRISYIGEETALDTPIIYLLPVIIFPCAAAFRLARFNISDTGYQGFKGVPVPAAGLVAASYPLILMYYPLVAPYILNKWVIYLVVIVLSWLMVSTLPLMALKFKDYSLRNNLKRYLLLAVGLIAALLLNWLAIPVIFVFYIILSLIPEKNNIKNRE